MEIDFAPMEGVTDFIFRKIYSKYFKGVLRYYTPFLSPAPKRVLAPKELREIKKENNPGINLVPQLLTNNAEDFNEAAKKLHDMGFETINLNLGCPSGTVTAKGKGAGFLRYPEELEAFLDEIFSRADYKISIKSRIGVERPDEWDRLSKIYKKFPLSELIVHPRLLREQYRGNVHLDLFEKAYSEFGGIITYNGDIKTKEDAEKISEKFPKLKRIMIGRGMIANPFLAENIQGVEESDKIKIIKFAKELFCEYREEFKSEHAAVNRMKGIWFYLLESFDNDAKFGRLIKKATNAIELESAVLQIGSSL